MENLQENLIEDLNNVDVCDSLGLAAKLGVNHQHIVGVLKSFENIPGFIETTIIKETKWQLTEEGQMITEKGSHEALVWFNTPDDDDGIEMTLLMNKLDKNTGKVGLSKALALKWVALTKKEGKQYVQRKVKQIDDKVKTYLLAINEGKLNEIPDSVKADLKKRKLISEIPFSRYQVKKGPNFSCKIEKPETDITAEMILKDTWKTKNFKSYNFKALGIAPDRGHLHPLLKVREQFCQIFLEMGFQEMPTNNFVESSFWNFDALFQPQQHPARDAHDTFFISDPQFSDNFPKDYLEKVKSVHSTGGFGSQGYKYEWKIEEAQKNLLRTHTTAVSARMLYKAAEKYRENPDAPFTPLKYFSIDRVFRNETLDATHLAEFHQIEGVVADVGLTLGDLMGILQQFFHKLGIKKLKFKPAYNPYTEPSMEIFSYHEGLKKWVEVGNSGVFRPEMLLPMGIPEDVTVIAWGLSLERPTMIKYAISNIRDLVGHKVDLQMVYDNPICILAI